MTVKNEVDIVSDVIESALEWSDYIIILDNNSNDGTWEAIKQLAERNSKLIIWGQYFGKFNDGLRRRVFLDYSFMSDANDWWCRLDADEFYIDSPREFLSNLDDKADFVNSASFQYYLTENDVGQGDKINYKDLSHYKCNWSETRFFKKKKNTIWFEGQGWPSNMFFMNSKFIRLKHYQYRNLKQVKARSLIRLTNTSNVSEFKHENSGDSEWYRSKGFEIPSEVFFRENRIVYSTDLTEGDSYQVGNEFKTKYGQSTKNVIKRMLKAYLGKFSLF